MTAMTNQPTVPTLPRFFRLRWLVGFVAVLIVPALMIGFWAIGSPWIFVAMPLIIYGVFPVADLFLGRDRANLSEAQEQAVENDPYFKALLYLTIPLYAASVYFVLISTGLMLQVAEVGVHWGWLVLLMVGSGLYHGTVINIGHELGHSGKKLDKRAAKLANALVGYGHFSLEHNAGHHRCVATPEDCASAHLGESFYAFAWREVPGAVWGAIRLERQRLKDRGFWHPNNQLLQIWGLSALLMLPLVIAFGLWMIPLIALHHLVSWLMLSQANYVEHYGLGRRRTEHGHYEPVRPIHSWNADQWFSNALLFNLQRHSDHHAHAWRDYQVLRTYEQVPTLPTGYPGSFVLALIPPLWFRTMDHRVKAWAQQHGAAINHG